MALPSTMKAIKTIAKAQAEVQSNVPLPALRDDYVLVKVHSVALNPGDWKHIDFISSRGCTTGTDFAGTVEAVGAAVTTSWQKGDRVAGISRGGNAAQPGDGAFAEYCVAKADICLKISDGMSEADAATLAVGVHTAGQGLYRSLKLPVPGEGRFGGPLLVHGASTATGSLSAQYAVLSGCEVVATCDANNVEFVKGSGANAAFDYGDPEGGKKIREYTQNKLTLAFDCASEGASAQIGGTVTTLASITVPRSDVVSKSTVVFTALGEATSFWRMELPESSEDFEFAKKFADLNTKLIASSQLTVQPPKVGKDGLHGVLDGLQQLHEGKVSGAKLVYHVNDKS